MNKLLTILALLILILPTQVRGDQTFSDYVGSDNHLVKSGQGYFSQIIVRTDGENPATVNVLDSTTNDPTARHLIPVDTVVDGWFQCGLPIRVGQTHFTHGLYIEVITSGTCSYQVSFY
jgi:hypothetical protein